MSGSKDVRRLVRLVCKPVAMLPEFRKRLLECLVLEAINKQLLEYLDKAAAQEGGDEAKNKDI